MAAVAAGRVVVDSLVADLFVEEEDSELWAAEFAVV